MKSLVIAEKPSVAADLARALGKVPKKGDVYENDEWVISSAVGHLVELEMPEDIDKKKYGFWRLETLPIIPEKFGLKPSEKTKDRFAQLKKQLARKDIKEVINACDAGREGELIFTYICQLAKNKLPVKRAWMQTMTTEGIREAFRQLRDGAEMSGLADAARCRAEGNCDGIVRARCSAHRTGLAADMYVGQAPGFGPDSSADPNRLFMTRTPTYRWLVANARRFGFVNYPFEPWHWEWTGESP